MHDCPNILKTFFQNSYLLWLNLGCIRLYIVELPVDYQGCSIVDSVAENVILYWYIRYDCNLLSSQVVPCCKAFIDTKLGIFVGL